MSGPLETPVNEGDSIDMGEPIAALANFEEAASSGLAERIRRTIGRRTMTLQLLSFSWNTPALVLKELWLIVVEQANPKNAKKEDDEGKTA